MSQSFRVLTLCLYLGIGHMRGGYAEYFSTLFYSHL